MEMTGEQWDKFMESHFGIKTHWILSPGRADAYAPLFEGTLQEAMGEALKHAAFWRTTTTVFHAPEGRRTNLVLAAKVSIPEGSALRYW